MMINQRVIRGLECCLSASLGEPICPTCTYRYDENGVETGDCEINLLKDAIALLKAQEPKPPVIKENAYGWKFFYCPSCGREFYANMQHGCVNEAKFCDKCGQAVKWE